ncbi:hypothetical protein PCASD_16043 [Puccinia coronata f. sp. avenae]|uniref:Uncharacterized protein n=1 Tax=Puccinia coronata f. sp. avenae TaxID=200324 RepID=A0A2N5TZW9_9BASI|nr:hypothetical protein PCASD_16043 [Puccinia coronata f. sp. avenae]
MQFFIVSHLHLSSPRKTVDTFFASYRLKAGSITMSGSRRKAPKAKMTDNERVETPEIRSSPHDDLSPAKQTIAPPCVSAPRPESPPIRQTAALGRLKTKLDAWSQPSTKSPTDTTP